TEYGYNARSLVNKRQRQPPESLNPSVTTFSSTTCSVFPGVESRLTEQQQQQQLLWKSATPVSSLFVVLFLFFT
ncbi:hypothetical protein K0M31_017022, partial [Melipona bicolor]